MPPWLQCKEAYWYFGRTMSSAESSSVGSQVIRKHLGYSGIGLSVLAVNSFVSAFGALKVFPQQQ